MRPNASDDQVYELTHRLRHPNRTPSLARRFNTGFPAASGCD
jgi:hypothetical protein